MWCIRVKEQRKRKRQGQWGRQNEEGRGEQPLCHFLVLFDFMNENAKGKRDLVRFGLVWFEFSLWLLLHCFICMHMWHVWHVASRTRTLRRTHTHRECLAHVCTPCKCLWGPPTWLRHRYCPRLRCSLCVRVRVCVRGLGIRIWYDYPAFLISPALLELVASVSEAKRARKIMFKITLKKRKVPRLRVAA